MECTFYEALADKAALGYVLHSLHCLFLPSGEVCGVTFSDVFHILSIVNVRNEDTDFVWVLIWRLQIQLWSHMEDVCYQKHVISC